MVSSHFHRISRRGRSVVTMTFSQEDLPYVKANGLSLIPLCDSIKNLLPDVLMTVSMFVGPALAKFLPPKMRMRIVDQAYKKLESMTGAKAVTRSIRKQIDFEWIKRNVKSGDVFCNYGENGASNTLIFGTGGVCCHVGMFLWENDELYFVESTHLDVHWIKASEWWSQAKDDWSYNYNLL